MTFIQDELYRLLLLSSDVDIRQAAMSLLKAAGYQIECHSGIQSDSQADMVLLDSNLLQENELSTVKALYPNSILVVLGEQVSGPQVATWFKAGIQDYIEKDELRTLPERLQSLMFASTKLSLFEMLGMVSCSANGLILEANDVFLDMLGYSQDELRAGLLNWRHLTPPEFHEADHESLQQLLKYGKAAPREKMFIHKQGHRVSVLLNTAFLDVSKQAGLSFVLELPREGEQDTVLNQQKRHCFYQALDVSVVGVIRWHLDGRVLETNQTFLNIVGYNWDDFAKGYVNWRAITPKEFESVDTHAVQNLLAVGKASCFEKQYIRKDGSRIDVLVGNLHLESETCDTGIAYIFDISQIKIRERAVEEIRASLLHSQRIGNVGSWEFEFPNTDIYFSDEFYRIHGLQEGFLFNGMENYLVHVHPEDREMLSTSLLQAVESRKPYRTEYRIVRPDGEIRNITSQGEITYSEDGKPFRMTGMIHDVTERYESEGALKTLMSQQESLINNIPDMVWMKDASLRFIAVNQKGENLMGLTKEEVIGRTYDDFLCPERAEEYHTSDRYVLTTGKSFTMEDFVQLPDGRSLWLESIKSPIVDADGAIIGITGIARDITKRKEYEDAMLESNELLEKKVTERTAALEQANRNLKETERLRSTFVSSLTHDLRTPLIAQKRLIELLWDQCKEESGKVGFLTKGLIQNNENLLDMVNKLLETYQYAEGKILLKMEQFDLYPLVEECYGLLREVAISKDIQLVTPLSALQVYVYADLMLIKRVLMNLIGNALENIPSGCKVEILAHVLNDEIQIDVSDDGIGIEPEFVPYMFDRYSPRSRRRQKLGSGLGLFICKTIVELHKGTITFASEPGKGVTFSIRLPRLSGTNTQESRAESREYKGTGL